ncbi:MAG: hypothetical protein H7A24_06955 [Leptospiraceae bacterium]|nr:hypothetical protein [Leptospiraceae bacterium]MCP5511602.1 hypothetical protein [Leptospiraceae bacterium]
MNKLSLFVILTFLPALLITADPKKETKPNTPPPKKEEAKKMKEEKKADKNTNSPKK